MAKSKWSNQPYKIDTAKHHWVKVTRQVIQVPLLAKQSGIIVRNDGCGGVLRGHYDVFFGKVENGKPVLWMISEGHLKPCRRPAKLPFDLTPIEGKTLKELPTGRSVWKSTPVRAQH